MCQENSKRMHQKSTKCYRIYQCATGTMQSYYNSSDMPEIGVETVANRLADSTSDRLNPFHAFRTKKDVNKWPHIQVFNTVVDGGDESYNKYAVFECVLSRRLMSGTWDCCKDMRTCTGEMLTIVRKVADGVAQEINWIA